MEEIGGVTVPLFFIKIPSKCSLAYFGIICSLFLFPTIMATPAHAVNKLFDSEKDFGPLDDMQESMEVENLTKQWNISLSINPFELGQCWKEKPKRKVVYTICTDDNQCTDEPQEVREENVYKIDHCWNVNESFQRELSGQFVVCYNLLKMNSTHIEKMTNIEGNELAKFCNKNSTADGNERHGLRIRFWITRDKAKEGKEVVLLINTEIDFSHWNNSISLKRVEQNMNAPNQVVNYVIALEHCNDKHECALLVTANGENILPEAKGHLSNGINYLMASNEFDPKHALLQMASGEMRALSFLLSEQQCDRYHARLNGKIMGKCHEHVAKKEEKLQKVLQIWYKYHHPRHEAIKKEQVEVEKILGEVRKLRKQCLPPPTPDPNIPQISVPPEAEPIAEVDVEDDILFSLKQAEALLNATKEECLGTKRTKRTKRQISSSLIWGYKDINTFDTSTFYWNPKDYPIIYDYDPWINPGQLAILRNGIKIISDNSCIVFSEDVLFVPNDISYISVPLQTSLRRFLGNKICQGQNGALLCCFSLVPYTFILDPGVDALIHLKRSSNDQHFQLTYETPDAENGDQAENDSVDMCGCQKVYNPWRQVKPGKSNYDVLPYGFSSITIKSKSNLIINGKYRFNSKLGEASFTRHCVAPKNGGDIFGVTHSLEDAPIRISDVVAESCTTTAMVDYKHEGIIDYDNRACKEYEEKWAAFVECVNQRANVYNKNAWNTICGKNSGHLFYLTLCKTFNTPNPNLVPNVNETIPI